MRPRTVLVAALTLFAASVQCSGPTEPKVVPVSAVHVAPGSAALLVGQTTQLSATAADANGGALADRAISWSSSDASKASVSSSGLVTAIAPGGVTVSASSEGKSGSASVSVSPVPVATVAVSSPAVQLIVGQTQQLTAASKDSVGAALAGRTFAWATSDATKATVSAAGLVTAVAPGTAVITVTSEGKSATVSVTVIGPPATVAFNAQLLFLAPGANGATVADVRDVNSRAVPNPALTYTSRSPSVATVSATGAVSGVATGQAVIVVSAAGGSGPVLDSLVAVVAGASTPVLTTNLGAMTLKSDTTFTISVSANWGSNAPKLSSGVLVVTWTPAVIGFVSATNGAQTVPAVNATTALAGTLVLAFADAAGFTGSAEIAKLTFHASLAAGAQGTITVTARELGVSDFTDLTAAAFSVLHRFVIR